MRSVTRRFRRSIRKHVVAALTLVAFHLVVLWPSIARGRVLSANDIFYGAPPWNVLWPTVPVNGLFSDSALSWWSLVDLVRADPAAAHWNPYVGSGTPGVLSWALGLLSPFVLPSLLLPTAWFYSAVVFLKVNAAFYFGYMWLREERAGRAGAAAGAMVMSAAGVIACWWLWPMTNAVPLYGALLWVVARAVRGKVVRFRWLLLLALGMLAGGYPATIAHGFYAAAALLVFECIRRRRLPEWRFLARAAAAAVLAAALLAPFFGASLHLLRGSGYLGTRRDVSFVFDPYPLWHLPALVWPYRMLDAAGNWMGHPKFGGINNIFETTLYVGKISAVLALLALVTRLPGTTKRFWAVLFGVLIAAMIGVPAIVYVFGSLPGVHMTPLTRARFLLVLPVAYLAAMGWRWLASRVQWRGPEWWGRILLCAAAPVLIATDFGMFARVVLPFTRPEVASLRTTPSLAFLRAQPQPFRIAATGHYLRPNAAQAVRLQDVRSHFSSEADYRALLGRLGVHSYGTTGTVTLFDAARLRLDDPAWDFLNVRFLADASRPRVVGPAIDAALENGGEAGRQRSMVNGEVMRTPLPRRPATAYAVNVQLDRDARVRVVGRGSDGAIVSDRVATRARAPRGKLYVRALGLNSLELTLVAGTGTCEVGRSGRPRAHASRSPFMPVADFADAEVLENIHVMSRFAAMWTVRDAEPAGLYDRSVDLTRVAMVEGGGAVAQRIAGIPPAERRAAVRLTSWGAARQELAVDSPAGFLLVSSEKLTPDLVIECDRQPVRAMRLHSLFAAAWIPPGRHVVVFDRRIGRGLWWMPALSLLVIVVLAAARATNSRRARSARDSESESTA